MERHITVGELISKLDNSFNIDNGDWIQRVPIWVIEALEIVNGVDKRKVKKTFVPNNRIIELQCFYTDKINLYDSNGCKVNKASDRSCCNKAFDSSECVITANGEVKRIPHTKTDNNRLYYFDGNRIYLNFDDEYIIVEYYEIDTIYDEDFECHFPKIPRIGILSEGIINYCMYKMLTRGYKHPVMNLNASQYGTNPYYLWQSNIDNIKRAIIVDNQGEDDDIDNDIWKSSFSKFTFD